MSVGTLCNRTTVVARRGNSVVETAKIMRENHVGSVIVVDDADGAPTPVGIVTDRDLVLEVMAAELDPDTVTIGDLVARELVTARETDSLWDTLQRMRTHGTRRMPVVDHQGHLVGILSVEDMLELLAVELNELARVSAREQALEEKMRPAVR
ncbi:CBS domain-containing protein [Methylotetracoccus oryzae]|uniref:CBS domain-containing protein n=1 Tax=Methylotetracoccus oryzae TaxID=1919059 RepID=UPI00111AE178|nr:CBS domain-containing protein [Methylotetracoccus oryzae]